MRFFPSKALKQAEQLLAKHLAQYRLPAPLDGPLQVELTLIWPYRATERAGIRKSGKVVPHDKRPDLDNLSKLYVDALVHARFLKDDAQIALLLLRKGWGPPDAVGVFYAIAPLPQGSLIPDEAGELPL